jgi:hypothetical protein
MRLECYKNEFITHIVKQKEEICCHFSFQLKASKKGKPFIDLLKLIRGLQIDAILNHCCGMS